MRARSVVGFSVSIHFVDSNHPPPDPNATPPGLSLPVSMGPIALPKPKGKRRWGWLSAWTLLVFAGGIAAGPTLTDQAFALVQRASAMFGLQVPRLLRRTAPTPVGSLPSPPARGPAATPPPPAPVAVQAERTDDSQKPPVAAAEPEPAVAPRATAPIRAEKAAGEAAHPRHAKGSAKTAPAKATAGKKAGDYDDPFAGGAENTSGSKATASGKKPKPASAANAASGSRDPLDNLMAEGVSNGKGKKRGSKDLDALLKDVQKSNPEPAPKRESRPPPAELSSSDISRVMAGVKTRGNQCARRLGEKGVAELKITVGKDGSVTDVRVGGKVANTPLGECVAKATRSAKFPPSTGLRFDYRIDVY